MGVTRSFGNEAGLSLSDGIADAARSVDSWWETAPCERRFVYPTTLRDMRFPNLQQDSYLCQD